jgi:hypothetical protein
VRPEGANPTITEVRRIQARKGRLTGDMVAALIDDADPTFVFCVCGHSGFYHRPGCQACDCDVFVEREDYPEEAGHGGA